MKPILLNLFFLLYPFLSLGNELVLVRSNSASQIEYDITVKTKDEYVSYSSWELSQYLNHSLSEKFNNEIVEADSLYSKSSISELKITYQKLINRAFEINWPEKVRKNLSTVWFRLYELEEDSFKKEMLISGLLKFYPEFSPNDKIFSPPMIVKWNQVVRNLQFIEWTPPKVIKNFKFIIINGKVINLEDNQSIVIPEHFVYLDVISDTYEKLSVQLTGKDLINWNPHPTIIASGKCSKPIYQNSIVDHNFRIFYSEDCIFKPETTIKVPNQIEASLNAMDWSQSKPLKFKDSSFLPKWGWYVVSAIAVGLIYQNNNRPSQSQPNTQSQSPESTSIQNEGF